MFLFHREDVYIGFSLEELSTVRQCLGANNIKYQYRVINLSDKESRGRHGSLGINRSYERQYYVSVKRNDYERAKYLVDIALHS